MPKFLKLYNEFQNFVEATRNEIQNNYEKKLVNLILNHFDEIADLNARMGKRGVFIGTLIQQHGPTTPTDIQPSTQTIGNTSSSLKNLKSLTVQNFRGFSDSESFDFDKQYTFVYGPNGSGKSSFCEAIEYALLGYINEAIAKRIDEEIYIKNAVNNLSSTPVLMGIDLSDQTLPIVPDPNSYRFCIVEKCRIDGFARIAANTPTDKQSLLSSLFGLDEFNDFVGNFNDSIEKYIPLDTTKETEWQTQTQGLEKRRIDILTANGNIQKTNDQKTSLVEELKLTKTFEELETLLEPKENQKSKIDELQKFINSPAQTEITHNTEDSLNELFSSASQELVKFEAFDKTYSTKKSEVKFKDLFLAAVEIETLSDVICPLCETPIKSAPKNPYENARLKIAELSDLAKLEDDRSSAFDIFLTSFKNINKSLANRKIAINQVGSTTKIKNLNEDESLSIDSSSLAIQRYKEIISDWADNTLSHKKDDSIIDANNKKTKEHSTEVSNAKSELQTLISARTKVQNIKATIKAENENIERWKKEIQEDEKKVSKLRQEADAEKLVIAENTKYKEAYASLLERLKNYKDELPTLHLGRLNSLTLEIYNYINDHDHKYEKAAGIELPKSKSDTIMMCFEDDATRKYDALQILSEGHLRCLGLSILIAKTVNDNCPIIIFDDAVNAIDDDHRSGIRKLIFEYPALKTKQIILTSHSEPFIKDLENSVIGKYDDLVKKYDFSSDKVERKIRVRRNDSQNHLKIASEQIDTNHWNNALYHCRCALELIGSRFWKKLGTVYKVDLSVIIRKPKTEPDLMSVIQSLNAKLKEIKSVFPDAISHFDFLLGFQQKHPVEWGYLNTGTHESEDNPTLDSSIVKEIYQHLFDLEAISKTQLQNSLSSVPTKPS